MGIISYPQFAQFKGKKSEKVEGYFLDEGRRNKDEG